MALKAWTAESLTCEQVTGEARSFDNCACNVSRKGEDREVWSVMMKLLLLARETLEARVGMGVRRT